MKWPRPYRSFKRANQRRDDLLRKERDSGLDVDEVAELGDLTALINEYLEEKPSRGVFVAKAVFKACRGRAG